MQLDLDQTQLSEQLHGALAQWDTDLSVAEFHGSLCGLMAAGEAPTPAAMLAKLSDVMDQSLQSHSLLLEALWGQTLAQLESESFGLVPLIERDDLDLRLADLANWCQGFLLGVGFSGDTRTDSPETQQALEDMVAISHVALDGEDRIDGSDLEEVYEYARMTAHLLFVERHMANSTEKISATAH
ncbi:UPF0149 family protein [Litorivicinus lipolyticus]|uniref:UPF0149 family protein n=1 Tax=Litorivicinus lipolyticus TaxID=418701 RepID=A0A5Q2Q6B6_9GAMM|nr:YecA family protein [Litorivicinus lipolyticus]QGG79298.1 UPF0149 family protein [Litorivicinus lipolyticus]